MLLEWKRRRDWHRSEHSCKERLTLHTRVARITVASAKQKGRKAQQEVRDSLLEHIYSPAGLTIDDVVSRSLGANGEDICLSSTAKSVLDICIEVKNCEKLNVPKTLLDHHKKYESSQSLKVLAHRRNRSPMLATLLWSDLIRLLKAL